MSKGGGVASESAELQLAPFPDDTDNRTPDPGEPSSFSKETQALLTWRTAISATNLTLTLALCGALCPGWTLPSLDGLTEERQCSGWVRATLLRGT